MLHVRAVYLLLVREKRRNAQAAHFLKGSRRTNMHDSSRRGLHHAWGSFRDKSEGGAWQTTAVVAVPGELSPVTSPVEVLKPCAATRATVVLSTMLNKNKPIRVVRVFAVGSNSHESSRLSNQRAPPYTQPLPQSICMMNHLPHSHPGRLNGRTASANAPHVPPSARPRCPISDRD